MSKGSDDVEMPSAEELRQYIYQQADVNRPDSKSPFGGTTTTWENTADDFDTWSAANPTETKTRAGYYKNEGGVTGEQVWVPPETTGGPGTEEGYQTYLDNFDRGQATTTTNYSPELENLFNKQFEEGAYEHYGDSYMENITGRLNPIYDRQNERMQQEMANRGQPVGGEEYDDQFGNLMQAQNDGWANAAYTAGQLGDQARLQDFNRLMSAMGQNTINVNPVDTMGPLNMAMNTSAMNQQRRNQNSSNVTNALTGLGTSYVTGGMMGDSPFWLKG